MTPVAALATPVEALATPVAAPASTPSSSRVFCPGCGLANEATNKFCPRCGHIIAGKLPETVRAQQKPAPKTPASAVPPLPPMRLPRVQLPRIAPGRVQVPRIHLPHVPLVAWAIAAVVLVLILAPLAYVLSPGRHLVASRGVSAALTKTGQAAAPSSAVGAVIPGVEAKTGLKYTTGSCPSASPCLKLAGQSTGLNAAAVQFSTAGTAGRQCVGYAYKDAGAWHFVDATCALPGQLSPLVGNDATVHVPGQCANVRDAAGIHAGIVACLNDGSTAHVDGGPNYADGKLWWHLEKNGWMAHDFLIGA